MSIDEEADETKAQQRLEEVKAAQERIAAGRRNLEVETPVSKKRFNLVVNVAFLVRLVLVVVAAPFLAAGIWVTAFPWVGQRWAHIYSASSLDLVGLYLVLITSVAAFSASPVLVIAGLAGETTKALEIYVGAMLRLIAVSIACYTALHVFKGATTDLGNATSTSRIAINGLVEKTSEQMLRVGLLIPVQVVPKASTAEGTLTKVRSHWGGSFLFESLVYAVALALYLYAVWGVFARELLFRKDHEIRLALWFIFGVLPQLAGAGLLWLERTHPLPWFSPEIKITAGPLILSFTGVGIFCAALSWVLLFFGAAIMTLRHRRLSVEPPKGKWG